MGSLRSSQLEVLLDGCEWHRVSVALSETALTLSLIGSGLFGEEDSIISPTSAILTAEKRFIRVLKPEGSGLGISIQGGADNGRPIVIRFFN